MRWNATAVGDGSTAYVAPRCHIQNTETFCGCCRTAASSRGSAANAAIPRVTSGVPATVADTGDFEESCGRCRSTTQTTGQHARHRRRLCSSSTSVLSGCRVTTVEAATWMPTVMKSRSVLYYMNITCKMLWCMQHTSHFVTTVVNFLTVLRVQLIPK